MTTGHDMRDLDNAARRLTKAAADLDAERQRDDGPRSARVRTVAEKLYEIAADLTHAAYDLDAEARGST